MNLTEQLLDDIWEMLYQERGRLIGQKIRLREQGKNTDELRAILRRFAILMQETDRTMTLMGMPARYDDRDDT